MTFGAGIQSSWNGKTYGVIVSDTQSTNNETGEKSEVPKQFYVPSLEGIFTYSGHDIFSKLLSQQIAGSGERLQFAFSFNKTQNDQEVSLTGISIGMLLFTKIIGMGYVGNSILSSLANQPMIARGAKLFGEHAISTPIAKETSQFYSDMVYDLLFMNNSDFGKVILNSFDNEDPTFFDLFAIASYNRKENETNAPAFIFCTNPDGQVRLDAATTSAYNGTYKVWSPLTKITIGCGSSSRHGTFFEDIGYNPYISMKPRTAIKKSMQALQIVGRKDPFCSGANISIVTEDGIYMYYDDIRNNALDPTETLEMILSTPLVCQ